MEEEKTTEEVLQKIEDQIFKLKTKLIMSEAEFNNEGKVFKKIATEIKLLEFPDMMDSEIKTRVALDLFKKIIELEKDDVREFGYNHRIDGNDLFLGIELKNKHNA